MKNKRKWISKVAMTLGVLTMLGSAGAGLGSIAYATPDIPYVSTNAISDDSSDRTITLWKYEIKSAAELGERGDGEKIDPSKTPDTTGKKLMGDVEFEIVRVIPKKDASGNYYKLDDPTVQVSGTHYDVDPTFTPVKQKTGDHTTGAKFGTTTFNVGNGKTADGIYLIREVPTRTLPDGTDEYEFTDENGDTKKISTPMQPFFAYLPQTKRDSENELIYDVHVYPKNIVNDSKGDKTVEGQKGYSIKAGLPFQWEATVKLPTGLYNKITQNMTITNRYDKAGGALPDLDITASPTVPYELYADEFYIHDELNEELHLDNVEVEVLNKVTPPATPTWSKLVLGTDYTVTVDGAAKATAPITKVKDGTPTDVKIELTQAGMKKIEGNYTDIRAIYHTHTDEDFNGVIENEFDYGYLIPGQKPFTDTPEDNPEYYDGGFTIDKTEEDKDKKLAGAVFYIATSEQDAKDGIFLASDGESYRLKADPKDPTGKPAQTPPSPAYFLTDTTDATGHAQFDGLKLDWYTESGNHGPGEDPKQDADIPSEATWPKVNPGDGSPFISKDYWLVETESPDGFELLKTPTKVTVTLDPSDTKVHVENKIQTKLPFTGGTGTMLLVIIAIGSITIGTAAIAIDKKRRAV
ncbi:MAG: SpaH/EbpB family LPXTG-anchored major pilin [Enterococcus sp.]|uniref:SpaH/EbpB family LPXTG-anchored major pilin n=1 Tax=Enterococcus sp. TaxID=35783 RepID=UPI002647238A|nr:SpaH/EbpB family LPXTG-anchored major pilin [Enterococcus sp.]MDN6002039.1 SpaH/EbpB family LPXTG-anchored major pilin [Enterococcus sp.]MDN6216335.1 SpaH/EbpB family LPXTG-anchored major pilin [Enterococcus sp.]MDN6583149.1 SpaH/EbpB family LPXTG-anchored major pilin [Enterococcus sp.]MDN6647636.1 SpaH/EbpB family LPXTG-anchored major pilin [Enterococcus sp.]MDN6753415.1 SpaH/EbpB family LPXTG-anchored major pilin [Enterococcus sp.]